MSYKRIFFLFILLCSLKNIHSKNEHELITIGTRYGGWTIPVDLLNEESICYCAGVGEDISFDVGIVRNYRCKVYLFDPTPRAIEHVANFKEKLARGQKAYTNPAHVPYELDVSLIDKIHFVPVGLWKREEVLKFYEPRNPTHVSHSVLNLQKTTSYFKASCKSLKTIMNELGHDHLDLLKLDIEGAEYEVLDSIFKDDIDIRCICLEFDELAGINKLCNSDIQKSIQKIERYIDLLKKHDYEVIYQKGYVDMTFLKRDR